MTGSIRTWGNSQGIYLPKKLLNDAGLNVNDRVDISVVDGSIVIRKDDSMSSKQKAWAALKAIRESHSGDLTEIGRDYKAEIGEYLDEKYGR